MTHYCEKCGKEMDRTARCEFHCRNCDITIFDWSLQYEDSKPKKELSSDYDMADLCHGGDLSEDD